METDVFEVGKTYMVHTNRGDKYMPDWFGDREAFMNNVRKGLDTGEYGSDTYEYIIRSKKKAQAKVVKKTDKTITFEVYDDFYRKCERRLKLFTTTLENGQIVECAYMEYRKYKGIFASVEFTY